VPSQPHLSSWKSRLKIFCIFVAAGPLIGGLIESTIFFLWLGLGSPSSFKADQDIGWLLLVWLGVLIGESFIFALLGFPVALCTAILYLGALCWNDSLSGAWSACAAAVSACLVIYVFSRTTGAFSSFINTFNFLFFAGLPSPGDHRFGPVRTDFR
jgi:hypothetical protein